jgi:hypothetical protein
MGAYSVGDSFKMYQSNLGTFSDFKNKSWIPMWFKNQIYSPKPPKVPSSYSSKPAEYGDNFKPWEYE